LEGLQDVMFGPFGAAAEGLVFGVRMRNVKGSVRAGLLATALAVGVVPLCCGPSAAQDAPAPAAASSPAPDASSQPASSQAAASQPAHDATGQEAAGQSAANCPGHPDALGTSRVLAIDPAEYPRIGRMQYPDSLPLADKEVVLTFDDGPLPPYSSQVLDILASQCVKATYFLVGEMARAFPAAVRRIYEEGHTIGTHSDDHPTRFGQLPIDRMRQEIDWGISDVSAALGDHKYLAPFFRIPGLARSETVESELAARGLSVFSSDTVADDWHHRIGAKGVVAAAIKRLEARGKGILLLHDIHARTVTALPGLLKELKDKGFHIVHVVPAASYVIAMANKPQARILASALPGEPMIGDNLNRGGQPHWPQAAANVAPKDSALPVPDVAAFEPDAIGGEEAGDVQWPAQAQTATPADAKIHGRSRKHKFARSSEKRKTHIAGASQQRGRAEHAHTHRPARARAGADGHHAETTSRVKAFSALFTPAQAAAH
jgi:peptidoglycan/xylan/chitin deacetylase (PgdA/CDA1 family)